MATGPGTARRYPDTQAYRQFGNAVVVPAVEAVAKFMQPAIERMLEIDRAAPKAKKRSHAAVG